MLAVGEDEPRLGYVFDDECLTVHVDVNDDVMHTISLYAAERRGVNRAINFLMQKPGAHFQTK